MAFGTWMSPQTADAGVVRGQQKEVGCKCWFTSTGKIMPLLLKVKDEDGEIREIREITVHSREKKRYAGSPSVEFDCTLGLGEQRVDAKLIYYVDQNRWILNFR